ncbi:MAG: lipid-binding SYLF domain-containing protein [Terriglobia bacterium]
MNNRLGIVALCLAVAAPLIAQKKEAATLASSTAVLKATLDRGLSRSVLGKAVCVAIFPNVRKVAFGIGGSYGRGAMVCRKNEELGGSWTAPVMFSLDQGSLGLQLGSTSTDFVATIMNKKAADRMLSGKTKLGSDAAVAAGPGARASTFGNADVLTYSRTKGVFAGVALSGASVEPDKDANKALYGKEMTGPEIMSSAPIVRADQPLVSYLNSVAPGRSRG